ncbi:MAG: hypothetical protein GX111_08430 [Clostridiales bacterium]|jgi:hypothetical protein|nr:hypothetical protein [Clostridiales bacterium]
MAEYDEEKGHDIEGSLNDLLSEVYQLRKELAATKRVAAAKKSVRTKRSKILPDKETARTGIIYAEIFGPAISKRKGGFKAY